MASTIALYVLISHTWSYSLFMLNIEKDVTLPTTWHFFRHFLIFTLQPFYSLNSQVSIYNFFLVKSVLVSDK
jgi:hypothetical protein